MQWRLQLGPVPLPREHGGWAMLLTPPVIALGAAGLHGLGLIALMGWILAYSARGPIEVLRGAGASGRAGMARSSPPVARFWLVMLILGAALGIGPVLFLQPWSLALLGAAALFLSAVQLLADRGHQRTLMAGTLAVTGLMVGAPLYYLAGTGSVPAEAWAITAACWAFFVGSIFRVKMLARERTSGSFRMICLALHLGFLLAGAWAALRGLVPPLYPAALLAPTAWAIYGAVRAGPPVNLMVIGKGEQWLTITFGLLLILAFHL